MNTYITSTQGWAILGFIIVLNIIGIIIVRNPEKIAFTSQFPPNLKKYFGPLWLFVCVWIDILLLILTLQGKYPFN